jgi:hypothetical protein
MAKHMGRDTSAGRATRYGLNGPGIEPPFLYRPFLGPTQPPIYWVQNLFPEGKAVGASR